MIEIKILYKDKTFQIKRKNYKNISTAMQAAKLISRKWEKLLGTKWNVISAEVIKDD